ncbi:MAG: SDR family oxidoreductase [Herminiimonas sp.]|uniref:SDR family oxidoreductase n=1 Tax=Herminiimonas sp. TaxID=1926289 RepID=UPI00271D460E|nr:SDR family oxidoreductase [Herminiimonas sp.]MDO9420989.1 SDR family oxidoreductase [Herminiimonas sp.]
MASSVKSKSQSVTSTVNKQKKIQREQDLKDMAKSKKASSTSKSAVQTSDRKQIAPPLSGKHLQKPGLEAELDVAPQFLAAGYKGSGKLKGLTAIITGGDSGIGRAVAILFAREGADVSIVYLNEHKDAKETQRHVEAEGRQCLLLPGDVKDPAFCKKAVTKTVKTFGKLDVLVNNAAFQEHADSLEDLTEERFDETMKTNVYGYFHMAKAALPHMKRGSSIINTGSVTGLKGSKNLIDYSTTKGAIHAFTMALAGNVLDQGIRVNAVAPGPVWTPLNPADKSDPEKIAQFGAQTSYRRPAQPEEISPAYVFLASAICSSYITGIVLPITGSVGE